MNATDTLSGNFGFATMKFPDGTEVTCLARKVPRGDGTVGWSVVDDRVVDFESAEKDTQFPADNLVAPTTEVLVKRTTIKTDNEDRRAISGNLIQFLGDPDRIIAQKGLDADRLAHVKAHPSSLTLARAMCAVSGSKWVQVLQYLPKVYPETMK